MSAALSPGSLELATSRHPWRRVIIVALCVFCLGSLAVRWRLSSQLPFIVDEFVDIQLATDVAKGFSLYVDRPLERTPGMTYILALTSPSGASSIETAVSARRIMWVASTLLALGTFWVAARLFGARWGLMGLTLLLSYSSFLERGLRIRADLFATLFSLAALAAVCAPTLHRLPLFGAGIALGLAFATTQKAVYFVVAFAAALIVRHLRQDRRHGWRRILVHGILAGLGFWVAPLALVVWYWSQNSLQPFLQQAVFYGAHVGLVADVYSGTWSFVRQTVERNPGLWLLAAFGVFMLIRSIRHPERSEATDAGPRIALLTWAFVQTLAYLQHTAKFPYIFVNIAPTLALLGAFGAKQVFRQATGPRALDPMRLVHWTVGVFAVGMLLVTTGFHHVRHLSGSAVRVWQEQTMNRIDEITNPGDAVFDGVGLAVTRRKATPYSMSARWYSEYNNSSDGLGLLACIEASKPPVAVWNYRTNRFSGSIRQLIESRFVWDWGNVLVAGATLRHPGGNDPSSHEIMLPASIRYRSRAERPVVIRVDGSVMPEGGLLLDAGPHTVELVGAAGVVQIMHATALERSPPVTGDPPQPLFASYSD